ncbi:MAG: cysteine peptidase family C39 domain-containing protein, partial [Candidatus Azambacteria bacterium]|nr:cysteine peptidase family C39 domain-containing protein [Candidatus Azambacteria bacterium]
TLPNEILKAKQNIESSRLQALTDLFTQKNKISQTIIKAYDDAILACQNQLNSLQNQYNQVASIKVSGKKAKNQRGDVLNQIGRAMDDTRAQLAKLYSDKSSALDALDTDAKAQSTKIEADAQSAYSKLNDQETALQKEILKQEVSPIVYDYFRRILGRDPSSQEYADWVAKVDYNSGQQTKTLQGALLTDALTAYLNALPELKDRTTYVNNVKTKIGTDINSYLAKSDADKLTFAQNLGLAKNDLIGLASGDAQKIITWLNSRSLHFGQSAYLALESLLDQKGITYNAEDLAEKCIVIDILTGVITPLDDGDPIISMFALKKVASLYGVVLEGQNVSFQDLSSLFTSSPQTQILTLVNSSHFVVITSITKDTITYKDTGIGKDKQNESITLSVKDFQKVWQGNILIDKTKVITSSTAKTLDQTQLQRLRGACLWLFFPIFMAISSIGSAVGAIISAIGPILTGIGTLVGNIINGIGFALGNILQGIGQAIYQGIQWAASTVLNAGQQLFASFAQQSFIGGGTQAASQASFGNTLFQTAVRTGLSFATSKGLESIGVNPTIANLASAFITGGYQGLSSPISAAQAAEGVTRTSVIASSVFQSVSLVGIGQLGPKLGIDPGLTNIIGLSLAAIGGQVIQNPTTTLDVAFSKITPQLSSSLAQYGIEKIGIAAGLDPRVTNLIGTPISAGINAGYETGWTSGNAIVYLFISCLRLLYHH